PHLIPVFWIMIAFELCRSTLDANDAPRQGQCSTASLPDQLELQGKSEWQQSGLWILRAMGRLVPYRVL
ncbi:MAG: hypothetical protein AAGD47_13850, partial [Pseudomonadota bacterium]